jgi:hypothetical protein
MIKLVDLSLKDVNKIVYTYYLNNYKDRSKTMAEYKKLNMLLATKQAQLVQSNNIVFLLTQADNEIEFHSMGEETSAFAFIKNIYRLIDYVKTLNVRAIKTYGDNPVFDKLFLRVNVDATRDIKVGPDGTTYSYYRLEF